MKGISGFSFSGIIWHEQGNRLLAPINNLGDLLNATIDISEYGDLDEVLFIYLIHRPNQKIHLEHFSYSKAKAQIFIQKKVPLKIIEEATNDVIPSILAKYYLTGIENIKNLKIPSFDFRQFQADIHSLFEAQGWVEQNQPAG